MVFDNDVVQKIYEKWNSPDEAGIFRRVERLSPRSRAKFDEFLFTNGMHIRRKDKKLSITPLSGCDNDALMFILKWL